MMAANVTAENAGMSAGMNVRPIGRTASSAQGLLRRIAGWITFVPGEESSEVREKLLHTLQENWFLLLLSLFWMGPDFF